MLFLKLLQKKPLFTKTNGDEVVEMGRRTFVMSSFADAQPYIVNPEFAMRADLAANAIYSDQSSMDILLKFNGISNPFSLEGGSILYAPSKETVRNSVKVSDQIVDKGSVPKISSAITPKTTQDTKRINAFKTAPVPNNVNLPSDKNITVKNGKVIFGADVTTVTTDKCKDTISRARLKEKLLANKIFNV